MTEQLTEQTESNKVSDVSGVDEGALPASADPVAANLATADLSNLDCIKGMAALADDSIHLTVTSIPFEELFTYSGKVEDVGNNGSTIDVRTGRFATNLRFVIHQLFRVTAPGCNVCIHIQQLLAYKNQHGFSGRRDFRGAVIDLFRAEGFHFHGEWAIPKDPQAMAQRLNLHSLQFKTGTSRSATKWAGAPNDYVLVFQKPGDVAANVQPLNSATGWITQDDWIKWASGVWHDIDEFDVLDGARYAKETNQEKHVCPLQLEVIRRCVLLYSNPRTIQPDVRVLDPFMGIGSTAWVCLQLDRNVIGFELKESYFKASLDNVKRACNQAASERSTAMLFGGASVKGR